MTKIVAASFPSLRAGASKGRIDRRPAAPGATAQGTPILLYDSASVPSGGEQQFASKAFTNSRNRRICLHEMRLTAALPQTRSHILTPLLLSLQILVRRKNGRAVPVTRGYVPVLAMCKSDNRLGEAFQVPGAAPGIPVLGAATWRFAAPIELAPGDAIEAQVKNLGGATGTPANTTVAVDLVFVGADSIAGPYTRVPYVVAWTSRDFTYAENGTDSAPPDALVNDLPTDMHVDRIIGRFVSSGLPHNLAFEIADLNDQSQQSIYNAFIRIGTATSWPIIRAFTGFHAAFGQPAAIETDFNLAPLDYLTVDVQHTAGPILFTAFDYFWGRAIVSIVGSREVQ